MFLYSVIFLLKFPKNNKIEKHGPLTSVIPGKYLIKFKMIPNLNAMRLFSIHDLNFNYHGVVVGRSCILMALDMNSSWVLISDTNKYSYYGMYEFYVFADVMNITDFSVTMSVAFQLY